MLTQSDRANNLTASQEITKLPDWGKMTFVEYPAQPWDAILPNASETAIELVMNLVVYESTRRLKACDVSRRFFPEKPGKANLLLSGALSRSLLVPTAFQAESHGPFVSSPLLYHSITCPIHGASGIMVTVRG